MKLSDAEKLMLLMLCDVYDKAGADGDFDTDFLRSAVFGEKEWSIPWKYSGIPFADQQLPDHVRDVLEILDMWSFIEHSVDRLSPMERAELEKRAEPFGRQPCFHGFDGNNETEYMSTASFFVNKLERFVEFKGREFNSHHPTLEAYKRMLAVYLGVRDKLQHGPLPLDDLVRILKEQIHPENRR